MARAARSVKRWWYSIAVLLLGTAIVVEGAFLVPIVRDRARDAAAGRQAKERQNQVFPVSCKLYVDAHARGVISSAELRVFESPRRCPR